MYEIFLPKFLGWSRQDETTSKIISNFWSYMLSSPTHHRQDILIKLIYSSFQALNRPFGRQFEQDDFTFPSLVRHYVISYSGTTFLSVCNQAVNVSVVSTLPKISFTPNSIITKPSSTDSIQCSYQNCSTFRIVKLVWSSWRKQISRRWIMLLWSFIGWKYEKGLCTSYY